MIPLDTYFKTLAQIRGDELSAEDQELIGTAFELGRKYHSGQKRANGDDYFDGHCIPVSYNVATIQMPADMIAAALLHDTLEDTKLTRKVLLSVCGKDITFMVDGVSKLSKVKYQGNDRHVESLRKFFVATAKDVRVVILKLCDRWHNLSTLQYLPEEKRERIAKESILIHAQLASRLNMGQLSATLKDLAFPYAYPENYEKTMKAIGPRLELGESVINAMFELLHPMAITTLGYEPKIDKRLKGTYSTYKKLLRKHWNVSEVYDLVALRVVVNTREDCYKMLGAIHNKWHPLPSRLKDYIALPKPNGYRSLHTTVMSGTGLMVEIQIRTNEMHFVNEYGVAAHHSYKSNIQEENRGTFAWINQLSELKDRSMSPEEYIHELESDFFETRIFALTPMGDVIDLPSGATVLDFAYAVHSDIGDRAKGAYVNGAYKPIYAKVSSESVVDIVTSSRVHPTGRWLDYIMTSHAKSRILKAIHHEPEAG